jgi:hypothetical protein
MSAVFDGFPKANRMRMSMFTLLLASSSFGWEKYNRYVFCLMDSSFTIKARVESGIKSLSDPDTAQVLTAARSITYWEGIKLNAKPVDEVWLAYMPPADPGEITFISNTVPTYPLLRLKIDAMCGSCFSQYDVFGSVTIPPVTSVRKGNLQVREMQNDFRLGGILTDAEKTGIADRINDYIFQKDTIRVNVLKMATRMESKDNIRYIAYYVTTSGQGSALARPFVKRAAPNAAGFKIDLLGRKLEPTDRVHIPFRAYPR